MFKKTSKSTASRKKNSKKIGYRLFGFIAAASFLTVLYLAHINQKAPAETLANAKEEARLQTQDAARKVSEALKELVLAAEPLGAEIGAGMIPYDSLEAHLPLVLAQYPNFYGISAAFEPYAFRPGERLHAPYFVRSQGVDIEQFNIQDSYDYTRKYGRRGPDTKWYRLPHEQGSTLQEPTFGKVTGNYLIEYGVPFSKTDSVTGEEKPAGVLSVNFSLGAVSQLVGKLGLGKTGYGFIVTGSGTVVSHPVRSYLGKNIGEIQDADTTFRTITSEIDLGQHKVISDPATGQRLWVFYEPVEIADWTMGVVFSEDEMQRSARKSLQVSAQLMLALQFFVLFFALTVIRADLGGRQRFIASAAFLSLIFLFGIGRMWQLHLNTSPSEGTEQNETVIFNEVSLAAALTKLLHEEVVTGPENARQQIPTGVFIQSVKFEEANNVSLTGYCWQKRIPAFPDSTDYGVVFPDADEVEMEPAFSSENVIGQSFKISVRQPFDYSKYPFDQVKIGLRIWHKKFNTELVAVPDLMAYDSLLSHARPGLDKNLVLEGWDILKTYFSFRPNSYNTNFGEPDSDFGHAVPELFFNIELRRDFMDPFISDIIPLVIVAFLVFAILIIQTKRQDRIELYGFTSSTVLRYCASLFFILIVFHVHIRDKITSGGMIYIEFFYFVIYFIVLLISVNSILFLSTQRFNFIHYEDGLLIKLSYWPLLLGLIFWITFFEFY